MTSLNDENIVLIKLFILFYADDAIILTENEHELQRALTSVYEYCVKYNLTVNIEKTKIIFFQSTIKEIFEIVIVILY